MTACTVAWTDTDPRLPHETHTCLFRLPANRHSRHECHCGLNLHTREETS